jgi:hypothetical protein
MARFDNIMYALLRMKDSVHFADEIITIFDLIRSLQRGMLAIDQHLLECEREGYSPDISEIQPHIMDMASEIADHLLSLGIGASWEAEAITQKIKDDNLGSFRLWLDLIDKPLPQSPIERIVDAAFYVPTMSNGEALTTAPGLVVDSLRGYIEKNHEAIAKKIKEIQEGFDDGLGDLEDNPF